MSLVFSNDNIVFTVEQLVCIGDDDVIIAVRVDDISKSRERTQIKPAAIQLYSMDVVGLFHNGKVDADFG